MEKYEAATVELILFGEEDIITTSGDPETGDNQTPWIPLSLNDKF